MTSRRRALPEFSAYGNRRRSFPWHAVRWGHVAIGFVLGSATWCLVIVALIGLAG